MLMIHEEAWKVALETLAKYAGGKVPCKHRQRPAFEALAQINKLHPGALPDCALKNSLESHIKEECRNANKSNLS